MAFMDVKASAFGVREESFNPKTPFILVRSSNGIGYIGDQVDGIFIAIFPPDHSVDRSVSIFSEQHIFQVIVAALHRRSGL